MTLPLSSGGAPKDGGRNVVAVLGPTNTGKTHFAIERMLAHPSGVIGLPLRLLAREVYTKVAARVGADQVALVTGEEKVIPANPRFRVCTVEALPTDTGASFLAIDEIQLAGDLERGHVFTDRILNLRGRDETLLLGAGTMRGMVEKLIPGATVITRPRMSMLTWSGSKKITRLPRRSAIVAFSADEVYAIAELIRRQRGGAAVVLGSLSPRTRNAQVELFQSGDVDFLVATDAIGMGLNLDVDHVAFAQERKFDGYQYRRLTAAELGQIAGRAGRHTRDGTFGVTSGVDSFEDELIEQLETHSFSPVRTVQWRNRLLDFRSVETLKESLERTPQQEGLTKAPPAEDVAALHFAARDPEVRDLAVGAERVALLWDICAIPDYRRIAPANHAELVIDIFGHVARRGAIPEDWFAAQVSYADRTDGDIDTLANRIAHIRTWTFAANRPNWLADPRHWQERTRAIEDRLSDALHERLMQRFVDRRTSVLMRRLRENAMLDVEITPAGDVMVEGQHVGSLQGFRFTADAAGDGPDAKAVRAAAQKALSGEIDRRADKLGNAPNPEFALSADGTLRWLGAPVARLVAGDEALKPRLVLLADEGLTGPARERVQDRLDLWLSSQIGTLLKPLLDLLAAEGLPGAARGIAYRLAENFGVIERAEIAEEVKALDQEARAGLRNLGVRFGAYHIYVPALLKPAPGALSAMLFALKNGGLDMAGLTELPQLSASGRTTIPVDPTFARPLYRVVGYRIAGNRAVRIDILERLADIIRPLIAWKPTPDNPVGPDGAVDGNGFTVTVSMTSLLGCSGEDFASILKALGYRLERRPAPKPVAAPPETTAVAPQAAAPAEPAAGVETTTAPDAEPVTAEGQPDEAAPTVDREEAAPAVDTAPDGEADQPAAATAAATDETAEPAAETAEPAAETAAVEAAEGDAEELPAGGGPSAGLADAAAGPEAPAEPQPSAEADETPAQAGPSAAEASDAPAPAPAADAAPAEAEAEPAFIEIWRPGRFDRRPDRKREDRRRPQAGATETAESGERRGPREGGGERRGDQRPHGRPGDRRHQGGGRRDGEASAGGDDRRAQPRPERGGGGGERSEARPERRDRPDRPERRGGGPQSGERPERREGKERRPERPRDERPREERRDRPIDPNSPFAKLAALKASLEGKGG
ncbi:helicase-related protein [Prosthecomicrobium pneumaticum]|uniref:ATP-dependent RNA helicase SUPV3L1/SUV3 n=1 Tax=Prosthecomicrobium pneumaticum TaxID=81895 RepID=A0A7W9CVT2_9HYPH|nr:helicase-related protein [Prosthecomicrobium pneumaticum]MBB5752451.1 ATP-dependent RNA helicase SUPV3L1/SUV3 [Prosthecomicrobium pneumaticum]